MEILYVSKLIDLVDKKEFIINLWNFIHASFISNTIEIDHLNKKYMWYQLTA